MSELFSGDDPMALDLVAHFLGIALHDNVNAAPTDFEKVQQPHKAVEWEIKRYGNVREG